MTSIDVHHETMPTPAAELDYEAIVVGAGVAGIYQIKRLTDLGINATVLEMDSDLGGTWWNNRYPGARFDSESESYGYSWSKEVLDEWNWTERFSPQPETLKYLNYVADKFNLRQYMQFNIRVEAMDWDDRRHTWTLHLQDGRTLTTRYAFMAVGVLSVPTLPRIAGRDDFKGDAWHPFHWPHEPVDLSDKRVGILGTGATAIQIIPEIAKEAGRLSVLQRRPNWAAPLNNAPISEEEMDDIKSRYDEIFETCASTPGGFLHKPDKRGFWNVPREERLELWDRLYAGSGFGIWLAHFPEIFTDPKANAEFSEYIAERIRERIGDPELADKLIPKDHGFGIQRVPLETNYFETYKRDNVTLVDVGSDPIECITETGIRTEGGEEHEFDVLIYATGFDSFSGAFERINIRGTNGVVLADKWHAGPSTLYGVLTEGFPNFMMIPGPQGAATNFPRGIERSIDWSTDLVTHTRSSAKTKFDATPAGEQTWFEEVVLWYERTLLKRSKHWQTGYNSNLDGHEYGNIRYMVYNGGGPRFARFMDDDATNGYPSVAFA